METAQRAPLASRAPLRRRRRAIPIIDARFQWKYTLLITALGAGITAVMGAFLYRAHRDNTQLLDLDGNVLLQEQVMRGDQIFLLYLIVLVVVIALALAFWGLVITHRISGPLYILARFLGEMAEGRYPDLRPLRKHDELQDLFAAFEEAVSTLRARDARTLESLEAALAAARKDLESDPRAGLERALQSLEGYRTALADALRAGDEA